MESTTTAASQQLEDEAVHDEIVSGIRHIRHPDLGPLVIKRPNPRTQAKISEARRKAWHRDLKDPDILSTAQVKKFLSERGVWGKDEEEEIASLSQRSGEKMGYLYMLGFTSVTDLVATYESKVLEFTEFEPDVPMPEPLSDLMDLMVDLDYEMTPDDNRALDSELDRFDNVPLRELVQQFRALRTKFTLNMEVGDIRENLNRLIAQQATYFADTLENRADQFQKMAEVFYCITRQDGDHLWESPDSLWDEDPTKLAWLQTQLYYFNNGITPEFAEMLETHGFTRRGIASGLQLDDSQDPPESKVDGESAESE